MTAPTLRPQRVLDDLRRLDELTGGSEGAERVCWGPGWKAARAFLEQRLRDLPVDVHIDSAGNLWAVLSGASDRTVVVGSHLDAVPHGGPLDGALGVLAALEVLRAWALVDERPCRVALVDWADEEGVRFGRSLFGSSAATGTLDPASLAGLRDSGGAAIETVLDAAGVDLAKVEEAEVQRPRIDAYLELHIEQGPVLEHARVSAAAVSGTAGSRRSHVVFRGQAAHAGTTPMDLRRDALAAAARFTLAVRDEARAGGGVATVGEIRCVDGAANVVPGHVELVLDQRHADSGRLAAMADAARQACADISTAEDVTGSVTERWAVEPVAFDAELVAYAQAACRAAGGDGRAIVSGALHDATAIARIAPTAMVFALSHNGLSHCPEEFTPDADLVVAIEAFGETVARVMKRS